MTATPADGSDRPAEPGSGFDPRSRPGSDPRTPATLGGPGFRPRERAHAEEAASGGRWGSFGVRSEVAPLRAVLLALPGEEILRADPPDSWLFLERVDPSALRREIEALAAFYRARGIEAHLFRPETPPPPNFVFQRDLFLMTPEGAVLSRMASVQRAGEERFAAEALARLGVPILHTVRGDGVFEGADALWLDASRVLVGIGRRTNREGFEQVARVLAGMGVAAAPVDLPEGTQHLLGILNFADRDLAAVRRSTPALARALAESGVRALEIPEDEEILTRFSMNFVALGPRRVVLPAGCPRTRAALEAAGVACDEVEATECVKAAGGIACLTGIIRRG